MWNEFTVSDLRNVVCDRKIYTQLNKTQEGAFLHL
jgi:hypothetical protein